jgi:hypothetical protein
MVWAKKVEKGKVHFGCGTCSTVPVSRVADMDMSICVGFGSAIVTNDGQLFYDGEADLRNDTEPKTLAEIETTAKQFPGSDWRVSLHGPLHGETYQRQGKRWVMRSEDD